MVSSVPNVVLITASGQLETSYYMMATSFRRLLVPTPSVFVFFEKTIVALAQKRG